MSVAYAEKMAQGYPLAAFFAVRFFRLAPLVEHWLERPLRDFGKRRFGRLGRAHPAAEQASSLPR